MPSTLTLGPDLVRLSLGGTMTRADLPAAAADVAADLGLVRMHQTLIDHPRIAVRIFETTEAGEAWLREGAS